jgi:hypothetical protein
MKNDRTADQLGKEIERRREKRTYRLSEPMAELRLSNSPIYQLKLNDASRNGVGMIVRSDSRLLSVLSVGQEFRVMLLSYGRSEILPGLYTAVVEHISRLKEGPYEGHFVIGVALKNST